MSCRVGPAGPILLFDIGRPFYVVWQGAVHKRRPHSGGEGGFLECGRPYFNFFRDGKSQIVLFRFRFFGPV